jgi:hypothetical protein
MQVGAVIVVISFAPPQVRRDKHHDKDQKPDYKGRVQMVEFTHRRTSAV